MVLVTHSMGSIMTLYFLNNKAQAWKDKYVRSFISMAGVWGGTARAVKVGSRVMSHVFISSMTGVCCWRQSRFLVPE